MKLFSIISCICLWATLTFGTPQFWNIKTQQPADFLPKNVPISTQLPTAQQIWEQQIADGWRRVVEVEKTPEGFRVGEYKGVEIDKETCRLTIVIKINIAEEQAAAAAAAAKVETDRLAAIEQMKQEQIKANVFTSATIKGMLAAILQEINKKEPFKSDPITVEAVLKDMETTVAAELAK